MEVSGTVIQVMPLESGQGGNGMWQKQTFVVETVDGQYTNHLAIDMWNRAIVELAPGDQVDVKVRVRSRQGKGAYAGRWFTNASAVSVMRHSNQPVREQEPMPVGALDDDDDGLPF